MSKQDRQKAWVRLIELMSREETYFPIFLGALSLYALVGCFVVHWALNAYPSNAKVVIFSFLGGAAVVAYASRMVHTLAYNWILNKVQEDEHN
jgi:hypothetical protein